MTAQAVARHRPVGRFGPLRFVLRLFAMLLLAAGCVPLHFLWKPFVRHSPWPQRFLAGIARICNLRVSTAGTPLRDDVFYVANHVSWLDIPLIGGATGAAFVAHDAIARWPVIGWFAALNNTVFVARADRLRAAEQVATLNEAIAEHQPVAIFPEGTTGDGSTLLPFKPTLFAGLLRPPRGIRVQPLLIDYGAGVGDIAWVGEESAPANAWRILCRRAPIPVRLVFLEPFDPASLSHRRDVAGTARERIAAALSASLGGAAVL